MIYKVLKISSPLKQLKDSTSPSSNKVFTKYCWHYFSVELLSFRPRAPRICWTFSWEQRVRSYSPAASRAVLVQRCTTESMLTSL